MGGTLLSGTNVVVGTHSLTRRRRLIGRINTTTTTTTSTRCGRCKAMAPKYEFLEKEFPSVEFVKVDVDDGTEIADLCNASTTLPHFIFYKDGREVAEVGGANEPQLLENILQHK